MLTVFRVDWRLPDYIPAPEPKEPNYNGARSHEWSPYRYELTLLEALNRLNKGKVNWSSEFRIVRQQYQPVPNTEIVIEHE